MTLAAVLACPHPLSHRPALDVPHQLVVVEGGPSPSPHADLHLTGSGFSPERAHALGLALLHMADPTPRELYWLAAPPVDSSAPPLAPLLEILARDPRAGAVIRADGALIRGAALAAARMEPSLQAIQEAGWRVIQAPLSPAPSPSPSPSPSVVQPEAPMLEWIKRPFTRADMAPVPAGWRVGPPDFVGVGTGKAGSSWWYDLIAQHPDVVPNRLRSKELHFLCHFGFQGPSAEDVAVYREAFAAPTGRLCGEWSGNLMQHPLALTYLAAAAPKAKLIALIRNPIDRSVSALNQFLQARAPFMGLTGARRRVFESFSLYPEAMQASLLARPFREILRSYPREQLLVLQYESCKRDPEAALRATWRFLGLREGPLPSGVRRPVNQRSYVVPRPTPAQRAQMAAWFRDDVEEVMSLFPELDRGLWADFAEKVG